MESTTDPMADMRIGMRVIDSTGREIGEVDDFKSGDPEAATDAGQSTQRMTTGLPIIGGAPSIHPQAATRLLRMGYVKIDRPGILSGSAYAETDRIARIDRIEGVVHLTVPDEQLISS